MKRHGLLAAGILGSTTALCLLLNRHNGLSASEEGARSFRQALANTGSSQVEEFDEVEDGFRINYFDATWNRVLLDLAKHEELTLVMDKVPPGRFARKDKRKYDVDSAIRILNSELESQGYRLVRQKQFLIVLNLDVARTEYARPQIPQIPDASGAPSSVGQLIRSASMMRVDDSADGEMQATPLIDSVRPRSGRKSGFVTSPRTRPSGIRQATASDDQLPTLDDFGPPVRPVSHAGQVESDEQGNDQARAAMILKPIDIEHAKVADLARTIYIVFEKRAVLQQAGINGLPTFSVYDCAEDGTIDKSSRPLFRIGIDQQAGQLLIEAPASRMTQLQKLVTNLDQSAETDGEQTVKVVPNNGIQAETATQLTEQIHQLVSMADESTAVPRSENSGQDVSAETDDPAINLRGEVNIQAMQDLGILILKGNEADVEKVQEIIRRLEKMSVGSLPSIHVLTLSNIDSEAFATLLTSVYEQLTELRQRGGTARKTAAFIPVVQPNAILIISSEIERTSILELAKELDQPLSPDFEFEVFQLKSAVASQVVTALTSFYAERLGLGTNVRAIADVRTNSVIVQGRPSELA